MMPNAKLRGRGLYADNSCIIKIFVKAETLESRSVAPDPLERFVGRSRSAAEKLKTVYNSCPCPTSDTTT